jgi:polysaccharide export outer membrane protein
MTRFFSLLALLFLMGLGLIAPGEAAGRRIVASDVVQIRVVNQSDLDTQVRVEPDGTITFPYVGRIKAAGLTEDELASRIKAGLVKSDVVKAPQVLVSVAGFGNQVSVQGAVGTPGLYTLDRPTTLTMALARAGGLSPGASTVVVRRPGATAAQVLRYDAKDILAGKINEREVLVENSDEIYVEQIALYYLEGSVNKPGPYPLARRLTVEQALLNGGGISDLGSYWFLQVKRRLPDGQFRVDWASRDDEVHPDDTIIIHERIF